MRQTNFSWPEEARLAREIEKSVRDAERDAAEQRRENRRWWCKTLLAVAVIAICAWAFIWILSGQALPLL